MSKSIELIFKRKEKIAANTYSFYFTANKFNFNPGEYLRLTLNIKNPDSRGSSRYFTIASSPLDSEIVITTRVIKSSFKRKLLNLKAGERVSAYGPMGNFTIDKKDNRKKIFISGGMGITTFYSMIKYFYKKPSRFEISLLASFSKGDHVIYYEELKKISEASKGINVFYTVSSDSKWTGEKGKIDKDKLIEHFPDFKKCTFYIVGPESLVEDVSNIVKKMGVLEKNIYLENFTGY